MKIVVMGTGPFAVPTFEELIKSDHEIVCLVTRPDAKSSRGKRNRIVNPMRDVAEAHALAVFDPASVNEEKFVAELNRMQADLFVVCDYGQILSRSCLSASKYGGVNLHGSLLPKYRGAAPINWAIYEGEKETGVTVIHMTPRLDGGPMLAQVVVPIDPDESAVELEPRMSQAGVPAVMNSIELLEGWDGVREIGEKQDNRSATKAPRLQKSNGLIDWSRTALQIKNQIRAFKPWPGSFTNWQRSEGEPLRIIIHKVSPTEQTAVEEMEMREPGQVIKADNEGLFVATGEGCLQITSMQPAGKREMNVAEFLRGNSVLPGDSLV